MTIESSVLKRFYPMNSLTPGALKVLGDYARIEEYDLGDYIFHLGAEITDLLYVLDGVVEVMDVKNELSEIFSAGEKRSVRSFTDELPASAAAVAKKPARVLRVPCDALSSVLSLDRDVAVDIRPRRRPDPEETKNAAPARAGEPDFLELPDFDDDHGMELKPSVAEPLLQPRKPDAKPAVVASSQIPAAKEKPLPVKPQAARPVPTVKPVEKKPQAAHVQAAKEVPAPKPAAKKKDESITSHLLNLDNSPVANLVTRLSTPKPKPGRDDRAAGRPLIRSAVRTESIVYKRNEGIAGQMLNLDNSPVANYVSSLLSGVKHRLEDAGDVSQRAAPVPESVSQISAAEPSRPREIDSYMDAMNLYRDEDWVAAHAAFKALAEANPATNLYRVYADRCAGKMRESLADSWKDLYRRFKTRSEKTEQDVAPNR